MLSFACQDIEFKDLLSCSFDLSKTEYNILMFLIRNNGEYTAASLADTIGIDRTTVQKAIKKLVGKDLLIRMQRNLDKGGYFFQYSIKNKAEIKDRMLKIVENWYNEVVKEINKW